jgi:hypothetical protein
MFVYEIDVGELITRAARVQIPDVYTVFWGMNRYHSKAFGAHENGFFFFYKLKSILFRLRSEVI